MDKNSVLRSRLEHIWEAPDTSTLFEKGNPKITKVKKGTIMFHEGDHLDRIFYIKSGYVKIYRLSQDGRETTNYLMGPRYIIGVRTLISKDLITLHSADALTDVELIPMPRDDYYETVLQHPELLVDLLHFLEHRLAYTERKVEGFIYTSTTARIANFLSDSAKRFGVTDASGVCIPVELTHQRIAEFVGCFRETATLSMQRLEKDGVIKVEKSIVTITDLKQLTEYAYLGKTS